MSIQAVAWVLDNSKARGPSRLVLIALANRHNGKTGECYPAMRTISAEAAVSLGAVSNAVADLVALGELEVIDPGGPRRSASYRLTFCSSDEHEERSSDERSARSGVNAASNPGVNRTGIQPELTGIPSGTPPPHGAGPDPRIATLVAGYVEDYEIDRPGKRPPSNWRAAAGRSVKQALADGEDPVDIAKCLGVIARESKHPTNLSHVLADMHAGKARR